MRRKRTSQGFPLFPKTLVEFQRRFSTERACVEYLAAVRWPNGFQCPRCESRAAWRLGLRTWKCRGCRRKVYVTAGTVLQDSHLPVCHWFWAAYLMSTLTPGISALQLQRQLGIGSYRSALYMCRRLRQATVNPGREPLKGVVELDDIYVGGVEKGGQGRRTKTKKIVVVAVENRGDHAGRVRMKHLPALSWDIIREFVAASIAPGTEVRTDAVSFYRYPDWSVLGVRHKPLLQKTPERAGRLLPWVHQITGNLKTWLRGTHHGRVGGRHLQEYLDEYTFRFNRRGYREHAFLTMLLLATKRRPLKASSASRLVPSSA